jgi:tetratricopeptide (TPR) repeat protein
MKMAQSGLRAAITLMVLCMALAGCDGVKAPPGVSNPFESPLQKASKYYREGKYLDAQVEADKAVKDRKDYGYACVLLAESLCAQGKFSEAEPSAREGVSMEPRYANSHSALARVLNGLGSFADAEQEALQALQLPCSESTPYSRAGQNVLLGAALQGQAKFIEADGAFKNAQKLDPTFAPGYLSEGMLMNTFGKYKDAIPLLKKAIQLNGSDPISYAALIVALTGTNQLEEATGNCEKLSQLTPKDPLVNVMLANIYFKEGKYPESEDEARKAIKLNQNFGPAYTTLSAALTKQNKTQDAIAAGLQATRLTPIDPVAHFALAQSLADSGKWAPAGFECGVAWNLSALNKPLQTEVQKLGTQVASHMPKWAPPKKK